jgi:hypothetical protein
MIRFVVYIVLAVVEAGLAVANESGGTVIILTPVAGKVETHRRQLQEPAPTCDEIGIQSFPGDCILECQALGSQLDPDESKSSTSNTKCSCIDGSTICTNDPSCADVLVFPGSAQDGCEELCGPETSVVEAFDGVEYAGDSTAANKDQTHLLVSCACDGVSRCGIDYVLFSDLTFLRACTTGSTTDAVGIDDADDCTAYCTGVGFAQSQYDNGKCSCTDHFGNDTDDIEGGKSAVACDDNNANSGNQQGGTDCFAEVGVSTSDCPTPAPTPAPPSTATTITAPNVAVWVCVLMSFGSLLMTATDV